MSRLVLALLIFPLLAPRLAAALDPARPEPPRGTRAEQGVKVTLKDGQEVTGELESYEHGRCKIRLASGATREIDEKEIADIVLTGRPASESPSTSGPAAGDARAAFERGEYETALQKVSAALEGFERQRDEMGALAARAAQAHFERLLERRDAAKLIEALRRYAPFLSAEARRALVARLADRFAEQHRSAPNDEFTAAFAELLARLADEGAIAEGQREPLSNVFVRLAQASAERKDFAAAAALYQGAIKVAPRRKEAVKPRAIEAMIAHARAQLERGEIRGAGLAARDAVALDPQSAEARRVLEDASFAQLRQDVEAAYGAEAAPFLRAFLARATRPEHRAWAEQTLARLHARTPARPADVAAQMAKYFPVKPGRSALYVRGGGEVQERLRADAVARDGDVTKVAFTLQEIYRGGSTTKSFTVEIEKDAVVLPAGPEREPLLRFPLKVGDSWSWESKGRQFRRSVRSLTETVTVGRAEKTKTFSDCLEVDFTSSVERDGSPVSITSRSTYAPGVGLVRLEFLDPALEKYNLDLVESGEESR